MKREIATIRQFVYERPKRHLESRWTVTQQQILDGVVTGEIFGMMEVDIETPEELKEHFQELPPIFKNSEISIEDVGEHMAAYAEAKGELKKPRRALISSYFANKVLMITPLLKWYMEKGLVVTKVHTLYQYNSHPTFKTFTENVSNARRAGDRDPTQQCTAETSKMKGNSGYGKLATDKSKHRKVVYKCGKAAARAMKSPQFRRATELTPEYLEIEKYNTVTRWDLPSQIAFFVYGYAKLRMLEFYYDFVAKYLDSRDYEFIEMDTGEANTNKYL